MKQRIERTKRLGEVLDTVTGKLQSTAQVRLEDLTLRWHDLVPPQIARYARPVRVNQRHLEVAIDTSGSSEVHTFVSEALPQTLQELGITTVTCTSSTHSERARQPRSTTISAKAEVRTAAIADASLRKAMAQLVSAFEAHKG